MAKPHWRIWVDWDGDGLWGETHEDITDDVMALDWHWGKPLAAPANVRANAGERAAAAGLSLTLRNPERKYSPNNPTSPLADHLQTGRKVWAAFAYPYDDFGGANGADLAGREATVGDAFSWVKETTGSSKVALTGGRAQPVAGTGEAVYTLDLGEADPPLGFVYRRSSNAHSGVVLRFINRWDYLRVRFGNIGTVLEDITWGYPTTLRRGDALAAGVNYFIEIELHGNSVRLFATDLDGGTAERKEILDGQGNAGNLAATKHGLWHDGAAAAGADRWGGFGGWRSFFYGVLEQITPGRDPALGAVCHLRAADELERLGRTTLFNLLNGRNLNAGAIANRILTWAGFSPNYRRLDRGPALVAAEPRALWRVPARTALYAVQQEEDGFIYLDGRGYFRLESAGHRQTGAHTTARATFRDTLAASPYFSQLAWDAGSAGVEHGVTFRYRRADNRGLQEIWRLRETPAIPPGERRDFLAESGNYDAVDSIRRPLATTDYTAHRRADGSGTDLTGSLAVSLPYASGSGGGYRGKGTLVRVANNHATATAYVTLLRLRADRAYRDFEATSYRAEDATVPRGQTAHGARTPSVDCRFIDNYAAARRGAEARLARKNTAHARLILTLPNGDGRNLAQVVRRVLSDRIRVVCSEPGIDGDFFIEGMELRAIAHTGEVTARWLVQGA